MTEDALANALKRRREISIAVIGRRTGRAITIPVWFVFDSGSLWLLPVYGSRTQWYRNLQKSRAVTIRVGSEQRTLQARLVKNPSAVGKVIERFQEKYTAQEIKRWYTGLDVAVRILLSTRPGKKNLANPDCRV
jgi:deazaflavin-dependent oxidoreductase (nitroreductase family)